MFCHGFQAPVVEGAAFTLIPRAYQLELFEHAKTNNSIMVLGTGSGKTFIAILLIKHLQDQVWLQFLLTFSNIISYG